MKIVLSIFILSDSRLRCVREPSNAGKEAGEDNGLIGGTHTHTYISHRMVFPYCIRRSAGRSELRLSATCVHGCPYGSV